MTNEPYAYTTKDLLAAFRKAGLVVSQRWIYRQEEKGNLILPKSTTNFKKALGTKKIGAVRILTKRQIEDVIQTFLPGGKGYYNYKNKT